MGHNVGMISPDMLQSAPSAVEMLAELRTIYSVEQIASRLGVSPKTVERWSQGTSSCRSGYLPALRELLDPPFAHELSTGRFRTIDLFAGIGGIRAAFAQHGGECVFTSEWNTFAQKTYRANYADGEPLVGDIVPYPASQIPDHDVLLAGFPCQPFSIAGVSKKNSLGRAHGFKDKTQGTLFFDVARIIDEKRPKAFLLENVKNLRSHDKGRTFEVIRSTLVEELGYDLHVQVLDGRDFVPQHRERIMIVGFREPQSDFSFDDIRRPERRPILADILHRTDGTEPYLPWDGDRFFDHEHARVLEKYTLTPRLWAYLQGYAAKHRAAGNGFGFGLVGPQDTSRTLSARYYKDGSEILISQGDDRRPRRLTPRECARLMGYPDTFQIPVSDTQAYRQFGNSVVVPMISEVARLIAERIAPSSADGARGAGRDVVARMRGTAGPGPSSDEVLELLRGE